MAAIPSYLHFRIVAFLFGVAALNMATAHANETLSSDQLNQSAAGETAQQIPPGGFARIAVRQPVVFKPHERFNVNDSESFERLQNALAADEEVNSLINFVLNETGKASLRELVTFKTPKFAFENGASTITLDIRTSNAVLRGWPGIDEEGLLLVDDNPGKSPNVTVELNPSKEMIEIYSTLIHELTHMRGALLRAKVGNPDEVLNYKSADEYSLWRVTGEGGEADAFAAEISAVIRYRNRYRLPYEAFFTPKNEVYFNMKTGEIKDRRGLERSIISAGGPKSYYLTTCKEEFKSRVKSEFEYMNMLAQQLKNHPSYQNNPAVREEANRLEIRAQRIRSQLVSTFEETLQ